MKAQLYVVKVKGCWQARLTIKAMVDKYFWMHGAFGEAGFLNNEIAEEGWLLKEEVPLGDACVAVELWNAAIKHGSGGRNGASKSLNEGGRNADHEAIELLAACAEEARADEAGEDEATGGLNSSNQKSSELERNYRKYSGGVEQAVHNGKISLGGVGAFWVVEGSGKERWR